MTPTEVMAMKDINYAKMFVRGKESINGSTESVILVLFFSAVSSPLANCFRSPQNAFSISFNIKYHLIIQAFIYCNAKILIISSILIHFQF